MKRILVSDKKTLKLGPVYHTQQNWTASCRLYARWCLNAVLLTCPDDKHDFKAADMRPIILSINYKCTFEKPIYDGRLYFLKSKLLSNPTTRKGSRVV